MASRFFNRLGETIVDIFKESEEGTFKPKDESDPQPVDLIFDASHMDIDIHGKPYGSPHPVAWIVTGSIPAIYGDVLEIDSKDYTIVEIKIDGIAQVTELILQEA